MAGSEFTGPAFLFLSYPGGKDSTLIELTAIFSAYTTV